jgi:hypothetical protein
MIGKEYIIVSMKSRERTVVLASYYLRSGPARVHLEKAVIYKEN